MKVVLPHTADDTNGKQIFEDQWSSTSMTHIADYVFCSSPTLLSVKYLTGRPENKQSPSSSYLPLLSPSPISLSYLPLPLPLSFSFCFPFSCSPPSSCLSIASSLSSYSTSFFLLQFASHSPSSAYSPLSLISPSF